MLNRRQVWTVAGVAIPVLVASALGVGGYHSRDAANGLFIFAGAWLVVSIGAPPVSRAIQRQRGDSGATPHHAVFDKNIHLGLDLGTLADVGPLDCEVQLPFGGGPARASQIANPDRQTTLIFPEEFHNVPDVYRSHQCGGSYRVTWVATQFAIQRGPIAAERFKVGPPTPPWWRRAAGFMVAWTTHLRVQIRRVRAQRHSQATATATHSKG